MKIFTALLCMLLIFNKLEANDFNEIENINLTKNKWTLTDYDIEQINCNMETKDLLKKFLPLMILYKLSNTT